MRADPGKGSMIAGYGTKACDACPWRKSNQGKRHPGGWYTKKNLRRLWGGLRSGEADGMTCHPTDPRNPVPEGMKAAPVDARTFECYGALLLVAREVKLGEKLCTTHSNAFGEYRKRRPKGLTRRGFSHWISRFVFGGDPPLPKVFTEDVAVQHPDFDAPEIPK